ncbi:MAG TPA: SDR family NAD(P)-dependent oxidoreductase [Nocardioides sp.]|nr:SDR family NAD(P)-dependent oxidoreductase [Nocardioides sp.]
MRLGQVLSRTVDTALDRTVVLGYTRLGSGVRSRWWPADPEPDALAGRRIVVTGATSGIGGAAAAGYLRLGASVHLLGRNPDKVAVAVEELRSAAPPGDSAGDIAGDIVGETCDVGDLAAVRAWTEDFLSRHDVLDGILHNAGTMTGSRRETSPQGHELTLAVHVLGPHLMTSRLLPALRASDAASVVWMSSGGMYGARLHADDADDIEYRSGDYDGVRAYARTKRMQVVLAQEWARRETADGIRFASMHPGWAATPGVTEHLPRFERLTRPLLRTPDDGADTAVWLMATRPQAAPPYFWHDRVARPVVFPGQRAPQPAAVQRLVDHVVAATEAPFAP